MKYQPSLDGIRAVAIAAVIGFHLMPRLLRGGYTGVDVFFVLSGYLITSVILHDIRNAKFSMAEFYLRRVQRLLPNAALMIFVVLLLSRFLLLPSASVAVASQGVWALLNLSNVYIWRTVGGYWGDSAAYAPLLHTWSLAVEEQFYLAFPLILVIGARRRSLFTITVCLTFISFALCVYLTKSHQPTAFYLLPTRAWEPLLGAVLAIYRVPLTPRGAIQNTPPRWVVESIGWIGLALIIASFLFITDVDHFPGWIALLPAFGALALLMAIVDETTTLAQLFSTPILVGIGRLSYSLYLWHWPLIVIGGMYAGLLGISHQTGRIAGLSVAIVMAVLAYLCVEQPLRKRGPGRKARLLLLATAFSLCMVACLTLSLWHPIADPLGRFDKPVFYGLLYSVGDPVSAAPTTTTRYYDVLFPEPTPHPEIWKSGGIVHSWGGGTPRLVVIGSSHALMYAKLIDDICHQQMISVAFLSADATPVFSPVKQGPSFPTPELAAGFDLARKSWIKQWHPDAVFVVDRWDDYADDQAGFVRKLHTLIAELSPDAGTIVLLSQPPVLKVEPGINLREYTNWYIGKFGRLPKISPDSKESFRESTIRSFEATERDFPNVQFLRVDPLFIKGDGSVNFWEGHSFLYADDNHLTQAGAEKAREILTLEIKATQTHAGYAHVH